MTRPLQFGCNQAVALAITALLVGIPHIVAASIGDGSDRELARLTLNLPIKITLIFGVLFLVGKTMKNISVFCIYGISSLFIFGGLIHGYGSILSDFSLQCTGNIRELLSSLLWSIVQDAIIYLIIFLLLWLLYEWKFPFIKLISIFIAISFLYSSFELFWFEFNAYLNRSYGECFFVAPLIEEYGYIFNFLYILPFIFAVVHTVYVITLFYRFKASG